LRAEFCATNSFGDTAVQSFSKKDKKLLVNAIFLYFASANVSNVSDEENA